MWLAVAIVGHAAALQTIEAGPLVHYQHYVPLADLASTRPWLLAILGVQTTLVSVALARRARHRRAAGSERLPPRRVATALLLSGVTAAAVSPDAVRYVSELAFAFVLQLLTIATIVVAVLAVPDASLTGAERRVRRVLGADASDAGSARRPLDRFGWLAAAAATALAVMLSLFSYERHPHLPDEVVYLHHARYFADGRLTMPAPPVPGAFDLDLMHYDTDRWFSPVPPGWPAVLAAGVLAGAPWLVNPVLTGIIVLLAYRLLGHLYALRQARQATALLALSPWLLFLGMSFMTHTLALTTALTAMLAVVRARSTGAFRWGAAAGVAVAVTVLVRPLDGLIVGALVAAWSLGAGGRRLGRAPLLGLAIGTLAVSALALPYNRELTGSAFTFPMSAYTEKYYQANANAYGFGPDRGAGWALDPNPGHGPLDALINANLNAFGLSTDLFGWGAGSLIFVTLLVCAGRLTAADRLMVTAVAVVFAAHFFYYFSGGPDFGARYWFLMIVPLAALTARGIQVMERAAGTRVGLAVAALVVMSLVSYVPWRAVDKYRHFRRMRPDVGTLAATHQFSGDLVLVRGDRFPDYASAAVHNPIDLSGPSTIYAWDRDESVRAAAIGAYPGRRIWLVEGPSLTGAGYRVTEGPLSAAALLSEGVAR